MEHPVESQKGDTGGRSMGSDPLARTVVVLLGSQLDQKIHTDHVEITSVLGHESNEQV